ncbi:MAG: universal stress protein [Deltaproteobacteria bacterium]|nr:universal stress protein [Deltaproteobacteria bacterium]
MTQRPQQILCPVDFDETSWKALKKASLLASTWQASLLAFHVVQEFPYEGASVPGDLVSLMGQWEKDALKALEEKVSSLVDPKVEASSKVTTGVPYEEILQCLKEEPADLVLLGPDRHGSLASLVLGRHTETVVRNTRTPVWIEKSPEGASGLPKKVAFLTDFSPASLDAASQALPWVELLGAKFSLVHILEPFVLPAFSLVDPKEYEKSLSELASQRMEDFQKQLNLKNLDWEKLLLHNSLEKALKDLVEKKAVDLIVLSTHGRTAMAKKKLGTTATQILRHLPCSALVLRPKTLDFSWL